MAQLKVQTRPDGYPIRIQLLATIDTYERIWVYMTSYAEWSRPVADRGPPMAEVEIDVYDSAVAIPPGAIYITVRRNGPRPRLAVWIGIEAYGWEYHFTYRGHDDPPANPSKHVRSERP